MENDMLSSLLSDPESLQNAMKTVSDLLGGQPSAQAEPQSTYDPASENDAEGASGHRRDRAERAECRKTGKTRTARCAQAVRCRGGLRPVRPGTPAGEHGSNGPRGTRQVNRSADDTAPRAL